MRQAGAALAVYAMATGMVCAEPAALSHLPQPVTPVEAKTAPTLLAPELVQVPVAQGETRLENPSAVFATYGYAEDHADRMAAPGATRWPTKLIEKTKTEPDKNVYLVLDNQKGPDPAYSYGRRFLFQGHESGPTRSMIGPKEGLVTRINLDADEAHRVTLMAEKDASGIPLPPFDGITWYPFSQRLLLTAELGANGGVWQATLDVPSKVEDISGSLGRAGYEGIQADSSGNLWIVEDSYEVTLASGKEKRPYSYLYRFVPKDRTDLGKGGRLQALQVTGGNGQPILFKSKADTLGEEIKQLHTYGVKRRTRWVTIHDTDKDGNRPFDANMAARANDATPFKRPENGMFRPGTEFREFYFTETGDTNLDSKANPEHGGFGGIFVVRQGSSLADEGEITIVFRGDKDHTGLDNLTFWSVDELMVAEDAGDKLHGQRKAFDSAYLVDVRVDYGAAGAPAPKRIIAQGRDDSATVDTAYNGLIGFQNDGDNEITGIHVSDGDPALTGLLGAKTPTPFRDGWRVFYTQQHGDNVTYEVVPRGR
jgi:hypothetical protein